MTQSLSVRHAWQRRTLPVAFSWCVAPKHTSAASAQPHISIRGVHKAYAVASGVALLEKETPQSYREAMASKDSAKWHAAANAEFNGCVAAKTWVLVPRLSLPKGTNVIRVKWVFKVKTDELGSITKYKARITPKGFMQRYGVDYFEIYASTGMYKTMRIFFVVVASRNIP
jgi:hypothetical protein